MTFNEALDAYVFPETRSDAIEYMAANADQTIPKLLRLEEESRSTGNEIAGALATFGSLMLLTVGVAAFVVSRDTFFPDVMWFIIGIPGTLMSALTAILVYLGAPKRQTGRRTHGNIRDRRMVSAAMLLENWTDLRGIAPICETLTLYSPTYFVPRVQGTILTRLLPLLTPADSDLLSSGHRSRLYSLLHIGNTQDHADLLLAILQGLEQIGNADAITCVRALADVQISNPDAEKVNKAARQCLSAIKRRIELEKSGRTLLRSVNSPDAEVLLRSQETGTGILLRPSGGAGSAVPEQLLRSSRETGEQAD